MRKNICYTATIVCMTLLFSLPLSAAETVEKSDAPDYELLFFMNPNGRPCQYQNRILSEIEKAVTPVAPVRYIKTTNRSDHQTFRTYGVRGLPMLVVVDKEGKSVKRFSPGVQRKETILAGLAELEK